MASTASSTIYEDDDCFIIRFVAETGDAIESDVVKIDSSKYCANGFNIEEIWWSVAGLIVRLYWEATTDELFMGFGANGITGNGHLDFSSFGGVPKPDVAGVTGDIGLTTQNPDTGDSYAFVVKCRKV